MSWPRHSWPSCAADMVLRWSEVAQPWAACFELAWEAFQAGSMPVGAMVIAPDGAVVTRGRSRRLDSEAPAGQLAGTSLAHAEINALAGLPTGRYPQHAIYTTLQPCLLCTAAVTHCHVGTVRYAAADPLWSGLLEGLPRLNDHIARRWPAWDGPVPGPLSDWQALLTVIGQTQSSPDGAATRAWLAASPDLVRLARTMIADSEPERLRAMPLAEAFDAVAVRLATRR
jgi:tRNA(adenine34) deaminase